MTSWGLLSFSFFWFFACYYKLSSLEKYGRHLVNSNEFDLRCGGSRFKVQGSGSHVGDLPQSNEQRGLWVAMWRQEQAQEGTSVCIVCDVYRAGVCGALCDININISTNQRVFWILILGL